VIDRGIHDKNDTFSFIYNELINYSGNLIRLKTRVIKGVKAEKTALMGALLSNAV
jgi:hypothetical protein